MEAGCGISGSDCDCARIPDKLKKDVTVKRIIYLFICFSFKAAYIKTGVKPVHA
jgi:hypothetical protein